MHIWGETYLCSKHLREVTCVRELVAHTYTYIYTYTYTLFTGLRAHAYTYIHIYTYKYTHTAYRAGRELAG